MHTYNYLKYVIVKIYMIIIMIIILLRITINNKRVLNIHHVTAKTF